MIIGDKYLYQGGFLFGAMLLVVFLLGCGGESDEVLGPINTEHSEIFTWIWAVDDGLDSLRVYDANTGMLAATFYAPSHSLMRETKAGPAEIPTVWLGAAGEGNGFTQGFAAHGDHSHMMAPVLVAQVDLGENPAHCGVSHDGSTVAWANDDRSDFTLLNTSTLLTRTVPGGSSHSAALPFAGGLIATDMNQKWARVLDLDDGSVLHEMAIDTLCHGDAWHETSGKAFLACLNGFEVLDPVLGQMGTFIPYPGQGRCNFLFHGGDNGIALGPVKSDEPLVNTVFLLDMVSSSASALIISGSALTWNRGAGQFAVSDDGKLAAITDTNTARAYLVGLDSSSTGTVTILNTPTNAMACALDHNGNILWLLDPATGVVDGFCTTDLISEYQFQVDADTDYIFTTSVDQSIAIIKK